MADSFNKQVQSSRPRGSSSPCGTGRTVFIPVCHAQDIALDIDGNVYVLDTCKPGTRLRAHGGRIGGLGARPADDGQFDHPMGLALDDIGRICVADTWNHRIQVFEADGTFAAAWDGLGLMLPRDLAFDSLGEAHIADTGNNRIVRVNASGVYQDAWGESGAAEGAFNHPSRILVDEDDRLYVSDMDNFRIQRFSREGTFQLAWGDEGHGTSQFARPDGIALDSFGRILTTDSAWHDRIQVFTADGTFVSSWGSQRGGPNEYDGPTDIAVDGTGNIYVTDFGNSRIQKLNPEGRFLEYWGPPGDADHSFKPYSIAVNSLQQLAYAYGEYKIEDATKHTIRKYDLQDGSLIQEWDSETAFVGGLAATNDYVFLADSLNSRIRRFDLGQPC